MHLPDLPPPAHAIVFPTWLSAGLGGRIDDDAGMTTKASEATDRHGRYTLGIVDNDPLVAEAPRSSFERFHAPLEVIWALTDPEDALVHCLHAKGRPDVLLTDIDMPRLSGLGLFHELQTRKLPITVIGISAFPNIAEEPGLVILPKESAVEEIVQLAGMLRRDDDLTRWFPTPTKPNPLSPSELHALTHYSEGLTTTAIAHTMHVSESSMKTFAKRAYEKLDAHSRTEAIAICVRNGWI